MHMKVSIQINNYITIWSNPFAVFDEHAIRVDQ